MILRSTLGMATTAMFAILLVTYSCRPAKNVSSDKLYNGKVVMGICGSITVQITDATSLGQNSWSPDNGTTHYDHVFRVANPCTWKGAKDSIIVFRFVPPSVQNCALCMAFAPTPDTAYNIEVVAAK